MSGKAAMDTKPLAQRRVLISYNFQLVARAPGAPDYHIGLSSRQYMASPRLLYSRYISSLPR